MTQTRTETDTIGPIEVPAAAYWGAQTERSIENFPFASRERIWDVRVRVTGRASTRV
jgi:fumarate hydratase class II